MFTTSTQKLNWMFSKKAEVTAERSKASTSCLERVSQFNIHPFSDKETEDLCRHFEYILMDLCSCIDCMIPSVVATALFYFKRFYLKASVMDYHPRDIMLTCIFLACKVDEFYLPATQLGEKAAKRFAETDRDDPRSQFRDPDQVTRLVLGLEPVLMNKLGYDLLVHTPWRPLEGLLIDLKARCSQVPDAEVLRAEAVRFINKSLTTDACFLFSPAQIALAAVLHSAGKQSVPLDKYVAHTLLGVDHKAKLKAIVPQVKAIKHLTKSLNPLDKRVMHELEARLEQCRDQANNPLSEEWQQKQLQEFEEEEEERVARKRQQTKEELARKAEAMDF